MTSKTIIKKGESYLAEPEIDEWAAEIISDLITELEENEEVISHFDFDQQQVIQENFVKLSKERDQFKVKLEAAERVIDASEHFIKSLSVPARILLPATEETSLKFALFNYKELDK